jgi:hypothetical protein
MIARGQLALPVHPLNHFLGPEQPPRVTPFPLRRACPLLLARSLAPIFCGLTKRVFYINEFQLLTVQQPLIRINSNMAREVPRRRRARVNVPCANPPSP